MTRRGWATWVAALTASVVLAGCTATTSTDRATSTAPTASTPVPSPTAATFPSGPAPDIVLAVDAYTPDPAQTAYLLWTAETATAQCIRGLGYDVPQPRMPTAAEIGPAHDRRYGVTSANVAATAGYHLPVDVTPPATDPDADVPAGVLDGGTPEVDGHPVPAGGCRGETDRTFRPADVVAGTALAGDIEGASYPPSVTDPAVRSAFADWSSCMTRAGYRYATPDDAIDAADLTTPAPSAAEIATATADVACKTTTDLVARWSAVEDGLEAGPIAANLAALESYRSAATALLGVAREVTGVAPPARGPPHH